MGVFKLCIAILIPLFLTMAAVAEPRKLTIASEFPSHWVKGTWLAEVVRAFEISYNTRVELIDFAFEVKAEWIVSRS